MSKTKACLTVLQDKGSLCNTLVTACLATKNHSTELNGSASTGCLLQILNGKTRCLLVVAAK